MKGIRAAIAEGRFTEFQTEFAATRELGDIDPI